MKLSYVAELIAVFAIGMSVAGVTFRAVAVGDPAARAAYPTRASTVEFGPVFLSGVAVAGGLGLLAERLRGRSPLRLGWGRWVWALSSLYVLTSALQSTILLQSAAFDAYEFATGMVQHCGFWWSELGQLLIATGITARLARVPHTTSADAREWTGRILAGAILLYTALYWANERWPAR